MNPQQIVDECAEINRQIREDTTRLIRWLWPRLPQSWRTQIVANIFCDRHHIPRRKV